MISLTGYIAGVLSDMMIQCGISVRKIMQSIGFFGPAMALVCLTMARSPFIASAWLSVAVGLKAFSHCGFLVNLQDIAPQYSGVLHQHDKFASVSLQNNISDQAGAESVSSNYIRKLLGVYDFIKG
ncbi:probable anion transporter 4, chloroplastic [Salvia splendens]|uniref:probable anion transporter 4, chloroplastic n=1 Tax=Salvia splendens TaxID=180675 RepID=UPI001C26A4A4|nr:probable anion transporter 4, chloroplastic [Salvia splendens]